MPEIDIRATMTSKERKEQWQITKKEEQR